MQQQQNVQFAQFLTRQAKRLVKKRLWAEKEETVCQRGARERPRSVPPRTLGAGRSGRGELLSSSISGNISRLWANSMRVVSLRVVEMAAIANRAIDLALDGLVLQLQIRIRYRHRSSSLVALTKPARRVARIGARGGDVFGHHRARPDHDIVGDPHRHDGGIGTD